MNRYRPNRSICDRIASGAIAVVMTMLLAACSSSSEDTAAQTVQSSSTTRQVSIGEEQIELDVRGGLQSDALFYDGGGSLGTVLVHQFGATMESWDSFAEALQRQGVSSVSVSSATPDDILAAVDALRTAGTTEIVLIGASLGGGAVMQVLSRGDIEGVTKVVLLSPSNGSALTSPEVEKIMFVATGDGIAQRTYDGFERAAEPKTLLEYDGTDHGQALLEGEHSESVLADINEFLELDQAQ